MDIKADDAAWPSSNVFAEDFNAAANCQSLLANIDDAQMAHAKAVLMDCLRHMLTRINRQDKMIENLLRRPDADAPKASTPVPVASSLPPTPATLLMSSPDSVSPSSSLFAATPACAVVPASAAATPTPPPLVRLDVRSIASIRGQGGTSTPPKKTSIAMCQTPSSWLQRSAASRSQRQLPSKQRRRPR